MRQEKRCVFCGRSGDLSKEHVWPAWLSNVDINPGSLHAVVSGGEGRQLVRRLYEGPAFEVQVRRPCKTCNHGWMSTLEANARPLLTPMILGQSKVLSAADQAVVALWVAKTVLMWQWTAPGHRSAPDEHYDELYRTQGPPSGMSIAIGRHNVRGVVARHAHRGFVIEAGGTPVGTRPVDAYDSHLVLGSLVMHAKARINSAIPAHEKLTLAGSSMFRLIWPIEGTVRWPPAAQLGHRYFADNKI